MSNNNFICGFRALWASALLCAGFALSSQAATRWSAVHIIPDADLLQGGQFVFDVQGYFTHDSAGKALLNPGGFLSLGIVEWVNLEAGYCGGPTLGFKARILGETGAIMPSLAIGAHNILYNREAGLFSSSDSNVTNEFYLALGKTIQPLKMRIHLGLQSIPQSHTEDVNPYFGIEEYFGSGLYASIEVFRRKLEFHPSLFVTYRMFNRQLELAAGVIDINKMLFDQNNQFSLSLGARKSSDFVKPGIWFGLRYSFVMGMATSDGFKTADDRAIAQGRTLKYLSLEVDSLRRLEIYSQRRLAEISKRLVTLSDSAGSDKSSLKPLLLEKIVALKNLYAEEPFEPERVKRAREEIVALRDDALPPLREMILDKKIDKRVRVLCISLLGDIGNTDASDILLDVLSQTQDPEIKIEILIALGKMRETRAEYVLEQLANDPVDEVAFTAQQVLQKLSKETGMKVSPDAQMRKVSLSDSSVIPDSKIKTKAGAADTAAKASKGAPAAGGAAGGPAGKASADTSKRAPAVAPGSAPGKTQKSRNEDMWGVGDSTNAASSGGASAPGSMPQKPAAQDSTAVRDTTVHAKNPPAGKNAQPQGAAKRAPAPAAKKPAPAEDKNW